IVPITAADNRINERQAGLSVTSLGKRHGTVESWLHQIRWTIRGRYVFSLPGATVVTAVAAVAAAGMESTSLAVSALLLKPCWQNCAKSSKNEYNTGTAKSVNKRDNVWPPTANTAIERRSSAPGPVAMS